MKKWFDKQILQPRLSLPSYISSLDKFVLKAFNRLSHDYEISGLLVVSFLLCLPDHYTLYTYVKNINIYILRMKFLLLISDKDFFNTNDIIKIDGAKTRPYSMFKYYIYHGPYFLHFSLYEYYWAISVIKRNQIRLGDLSLTIVTGKNSCFIMLFQKKNNWLLLHYMETCQRMKILKIQY